MGRYAYVRYGNLQFEYKFAFAEQCSNLGYFLRDALPEYVSRYISEDFGGGEYVEIYGDKDKILDKLRKYIDEMKKKLVIGKISGEEPVCPLCGSPKCFKHSVLMLEEFLNAVDKCDCERVDSLIYVEY